MNILSFTREKHAPPSPSVHERALVIRNRTLNRLLVFFVLLGPALAIKMGSREFAEITYSECMGVSLYAALVALGHRIALKKYPKSITASFFAILSQGLLLVYLEYSGVNVHFAWFLVPLLSLVFCSLRMFLSLSFANFLLMALAAWLSNNPSFGSMGFAQVSNSAIAHLISDRLLEYIFVAVAGYAVVHAIIDHLKELGIVHTSGGRQEFEMSEQMRILQSMADIYERVNLIDFVEMTEMSLREKKLNQIGLDFNKQDHTNMTQRMIPGIVPDHKQDFIHFTNITTVQERLRNKRSISGDFIDMTSGWFRAQYIAIDRNEEQLPIKIIFTIQDIENEKRREEYLIRIAMTDELTRVYNRRRFEEDIARHAEQGQEKGFTLYSVDINDLKRANDAFGHAAGDEIIKAAADILLRVAGSDGKVYRIGGDEFIMLLCTDDCEQIRETIKTRAQEWRGVLIDKLSVAVGYASCAQYPGCDLLELEKIADRQMYQDKASYYQSAGIDRRKTPTSPIYMQANKAPLAG